MYKVYTVLGYFIDAFPDKDTAYAQCNKWNQIAGHVLYCVREPAKELTS